MGHRKPPRTFDFYQLEDRILLSGDLPDADGLIPSPDADVLADAVEQLQDSAESSRKSSLNDSLTSDAHGQLDESAAERTELASNLDSSDRLEVVFIDAGVEDADQLLQDLRGSESDQTQWLVVHLSDDKNGIEQISQNLAQLSGVDAIHLISHGDSSGVQLGNTRLDLNTAESHAGQIAAWSTSLDADADLLIYGCDLASTEEGITLLESISALCDCDVAASTDATGQALLGGDWVLEYQVGDVQTDVAFGYLAQASWNSILDNSVPGAQSTNEDTTLVFSSANGNAVSFIETAGTQLQVTASVAQGTLTLSQTDGLTFDSGTNGSSSLTVTGSVEDINAAFEGLQYLSSLNFNGADSLSITSTNLTQFDLDNDSALIGHYEFDDGLQNSVSPGTPAATLVNQAFIGTDPIFGGVLELDGDGDEAVVSGLFGEPANVTLAVWANFADEDRGDILSFGDSISIWYNNATDELHGYFDRSTSSWQRTTYVVDIGGDGWHHFAYTIDDNANEQVLYLDGVEVARTTYTSSISYNLGNDVHIGNHGNNLADWEIDGQIDDVRIYNRVLSGAEVAELDALPYDRTDVDQIAITISPVNDAPVGVDVTVSTEEDTDYQFAVTDFQLTDLEGHGFSGVVFNSTSAGTLYLDADLDGIVDSGELISSTTFVAATDITNGLLKFKPVADANGAGHATINFQVVDDGGTLNGGVDTDPTANVVTVDVSAVNDAPVIAAR